MDLQFSKEPVAWLNLAKVLLLVLVGFGVSIAPEQQANLVQLVGALLAVVGYGGLTYAEREAVFHDRPGLAEAVALLEDEELQAELAVSAQEAYDTGEEHPGLGT